MGTAGTGSTMETDLFVHFAEIAGVFVGFGTHPRQTRTPSEKR
ncbi:hypothetical protein RCH16_001742 [Cryobacterium sp. MP_M5]|nr:hypothetical protein [Cryobacterium sp. MP_M3]MEC5176734.1 hypothetical protein [Cryobacterium sp. MP_M5]